MAKNVWEEIVSFGKKYGYIPEQLADGTPLDPKEVEDAGFWEAIKT